MSKTTFHHRDCDLSPEHIGSCKYHGVALEEHKNDPINPDHYKDGGIETIDYLKAKLTPEEFRGFLKGNALKYMSRMGKKGDALEDLKKAQWYSERLERELKNV